jgi:hypothetical protein
VLPQLLEKMEPDEEAMEYFAYEEYQQQQQENRMRDMAQRMLDHWRDLCARPGTTSIVHKPPPTLPLVEWHTPSVGVENWQLAEQAVNLFLDLDRSRGRGGGGAAPMAPPTSRQSQDHTATESELIMAGDDGHDDDDTYEGEVEQRRMQWMGKLMAWVFAPRGTHACLSFLDDDNHDDHADAAAAAADDNRGRLEDDEGEDKLEDDDDEDKLALFSWLGPSLSWWIQMWWSYRLDTTSRYMDEVCRYVAQRLPQAWRMLRACVATTTTAATTSHHHHQSRFTRAQLEHVAKVLIVCLRCFDGAYAHPLRDAMYWLCAPHSAI